MPGFAQFSAGSIDAEGMRYGFATSASNASTNRIATPIVTTQSTTVRHGCGRRLVARSRTRIGAQRTDSDRLELLERLPARRAVAERPARRRAEDVLEPGVGRAAVRAAEDARLQLQQLRGGGLPRGGRREAGRTELLPAGRRDLVGRPRVVVDDPHLRLRAEPGDGLLQRPRHRLEGGAAEEGRRQLYRDVPGRDLDRTDDAEVDERDDGKLRIRDPLERRPDLGFAHHCAPAGAERRTLV